MTREFVKVRVPVVRCAECDAAYNLVAPLMPANRWIYSQPKACKRAKHALAVATAVEAADVEFRDLVALVEY